MTFSQCVHGVYDEKNGSQYIMKYSQNDSFRKDSEEYHIIRRRYFIMVDAGFLSIIPPIVAIVLALVTKEVIFCTKKRLRTNYLVRQPKLLVFSSIIKLAVVFWDKRLLIRIFFLCILLQIFLYGT